VPRADVGARRGFGDEARRRGAGALARGGGTRTRGFFRFLADEMDIDPAALRAATDAYEAARDAARLAR
jgi:hypothetical protein